MTYRRSKIAELVDVAQRMLAGNVGPIEGARRICRLRAAVEDEKNQVFLPFIAINSESDDLVVGDRSLWSTEFLEDIDRRYESYDRALRPGIGDDCRALLAVFLPLLGDRSP